MGKLQCNGSVMEAFRLRLDFDVLVEFQGQGWRSHDTGGACGFRDERRVGWKSQCKIPTLAAKNAAEMGHPRT